MFKMSRLRIFAIGLFVLIFLINTINCERGQKFNKNHHVPSQKPTVDETMFYPDSGMEEQRFSDKQHINFGETDVIVYESSKITYENGTIVTNLVLDNGISLNLNESPRQINEDIIYTIFGNIQFMTPDTFTYLLEFEADPDNFKVVKYERKLPIMTRANPKHLAALAGG